MNRRSWSRFVRRNYWKLKQLHIDLDNMNTIRFQSQETLKHRLAKKAICHYLFENSHFFKTEQKIRAGICDVIDLNNLIIYEVESYPTPKTEMEKLEQYRHPLIEDIVIIDLRKLDFDWYELVRFSDEIKKKVNLDTWF